MSGSGTVGANVEGLHRTGGRISGRSAGGSSAATNLSRNLDSSGGLTGHGRLKSAISAFVTNGVIDNSNLLGTQLTAAGNNVANVAGTMRTEDEEGARVIQTEASASSAVSDRIHGNTAV